MLKLSFPGSSSSKAHRRCSKFRFSQKSSFSRLFRDFYGFFFSFNQILIFLSLPILINILITCLSLSFQSLMEARNCVTVQQYQPEYNDMNQIRAVFSLLYLLIWVAAIVGNTLVLYVLTFNQVIDKNPKIGSIWYGKHGNPTVTHQICVFSLRISDFPHLLSTKHRVYGVIQSTWRLALLNQFGFRWEPLFWIREVMGRVLSIIMTRFPKIQFSGILELQGP